MSRLPRLTWWDSTSGVGNGAGRKTLSGVRANVIASNDERNVARFPKLPNGTCSGRNQGRAREQSRVKIDGHIAVPGTEIPNYKSQIPSKSQILNFKIQNVLNLGFRSFDIVCDLVLTCPPKPRCRRGIWCFRAGRGETEFGLRMCCKIIKIPAD